MDKPDLLISQIQSNLLEIRRCLSPDAAKTFETLYYQISDRLSDGNPPDVVASELKALVAEYPAVAQILGWELPHSAEPQQEKLDDASLQILRDEPTAVPPTPSMELPPSIPQPSQGDAKMNGNAPPIQPVQPTHWTPEIIMQFFKEVVTSILAILVVGYTVYLAGIASSFVGDPQKVSDAKDILLFMMGITGVVLGYYFGRIPADARAAQSQQEARQAQQQSEQIAAQAEQVMERTQRILTGSLPGSQGGAVRRDTAEVTDGETAAQLRNLQDDLNGLRRLMRSR